MKPLFKDKSGNIIAVDLVFGRKDRWAFYRKSNIKARGKKIKLPTHPNYPYRTEEQAVQGLVAYGKSRRDWEPL